MCDQDEGDADIALQVLQFDLHLAAELAVEGRDERTTPVREIMGRELVYVGPEATVDECMAVMTERRIRHLPVLGDGSEVVGIVSIGDVVKFQSREQSVQIRFLTEYISG